MPELLCSSAENGDKDTEGEFYDKKIQEEPWHRFTCGCFGLIINRKYYDAE